MAPVARRLAARRGVLEPLQTARSIDGQIEELRTVLSRHAEIPAVLIGFSWGAWLSLLLASRHAELVRKLILISSGPLTESHAAQLRTARLQRLNESERLEFEAAVAALEHSSDRDCDASLARLGQLASKADNYAPLAESERPAVHLSGDIYREVWAQAAELRRTGELLKRARQVRCPVVAIQGDYDPAPAHGVSEPLSAVLPDFRVVRLEKCGHIPWLERHAREEFHRVLLSEIE